MHANRASAAILRTAVRPFPGRGSAISLPSCVVGRLTRAVLQSRNAQPASSVDARASTPFGRTRELAWPIQFFTAPECTAEACVYIIRLSAAASRLSFSVKTAPPRKREKLDLGRGTADNWQRSAVR